MNILVCDDEKEIADLIEIYLQNEGYQVFKFYESKNILEFLKTKKIDLAILDIMMNDLDGFQLCQEIRKNYNFPIIFVTAKINSLDKIKGLSLGADDYLTKPFEPLELVARVKANIRRYKEYQVDNSEEIYFRGLVINNKTHKCSLNNTELDLTPIEFKILWYLCQNRGEVVACEDLFFHVWQEKYYENDNNTIMVHIRHLREKMHDTGKDPKYIKTIWGVGYIIEK